MYVYINSEPGLHTVGFYQGDDFHPDSDWTDQRKAAKRVAFLNGSSVNFDQEIIEGNEQT